MRLEPTPRTEHALRVSARLITSSTILHLASDELENAVNQEQMENPALDVIEQKVCLFCGAPMYGHICAACGHFAQPTQPLAPLHEAPAPYESEGEPQWAYQQQTFYDIDNYGFAQVDSEDEYDPLAHISLGETLEEMLLQQLETLIAPEEAPIAEQLVGNLNERGYLEIGIEEIAEHLDVSTQRVEYVLHQLQTLEPLGIGARNLRECLLIQLEALKELKEPHPLAYALIDGYLEQLGRNQFHEIARQLKAPEQEVRRASQYIRSTLHPYPAHLYRADTRSSRQGSGVTYIRPDVIIRKGEIGFEVELIEEKRYNFHIETNYSVQQGSPTAELSSHEVQRYMHHHRDRARFFVDCIHRRWQTLKHVMEIVIDHQQEFLEKGVRYLQPLTRAEVAARLNLDEGTVSRATANKYALLPNGRLMPLSDFFDSSLSIKDILRELIQSEDPRHRLSDDELARLLNVQGIPLARRTVTKYREEMGIGSSRER
ncbi:RNA polymerase sigma-54 factor [Ktedonosporobacter rubrisoli]|uniref:RNA polymerase sigma-54 factor n=1 Tax=Ktedonosporobacter rubrisoli TaxID=2509675 RepID=A0A4P6K206_KTERU|nr:RNA polymerase factor sigma-54 [Ktedonosporobacter rubrisoli]QBD82154.1 RNA polymerase sigma-54 factor [Ktedonosporobacter rubrisoli]